MKIIGTNRRNSSDDPSQYIVELSSAEMHRLLSGRSSKFPRLESGSVVEICNEYDDAMKIRERCYAAVKLPETLVAIADVLRLVVPQAKVIADGVAPKEDEFDQH